MSAPWTRLRRDLVQQPPLTAWHPVLIRLAVLGGLAGMLALVGLLSTQQSWDVVLVVAALPLLFVLAARNIHRIDWGVIAIAATAAFVRFTIPTGTESVIVASLALTVVVVAAWVVHMVVIEGRISLEPAPTNLPALGFMCAAVISLFWGIAFRDPLVSIWSSFPFVQLASLAVLILLPSTFLLVGNCIRSSTHLRALVGLLIVIGVLGLVEEVLRVSMPVNVLGLFPTWAVAVSAALALFYKKLPRWQRVLLLVFTAGWVWYGYFRRLSWLAAWLPALVALAVVLFMRSRWFVILIVIALILAGVYYVRQRYTTEISESGSTRLAAWRQNLKIVGKHSLFGTGPAGYAVYYMTYFPTWAMATHSNYLDILSQTGMVGLTFCLWFFSALLLQGYRLCQRLRGRGDLLEGLANAAFAGTVACVVAMAIGDWLFPFAYTQTIAGFDYVVYSWLFMGMIPVVERMTRQEDRVAGSLEGDQ